MQIKIKPRYVKKENGLRAFQKETIMSIKNPDVRIVLVEAPVGSGKS
jgi:superfamily II DNA or RNA helicase